MVKNERLHIVFFSLLRAGLWSRSVDSIGHFPLSTTEWKELYDLCIAQTVEGLVFDAVEQLSMEFMPPKDLWLAWIVRVGKIEQYNKKMNQCIAEQITYFRRSDVEPILLKGQGIAISYERPYRRVPGDVDWYFSTDQAYKKANDWALEETGKVVYVPGRSVCYTYKGFDIDHHTSLIDLYSPFSKRFLKRLIDIESIEIKRICIEEVNCLVLSPVLNIIQVVSHILKHLLSFGLGLRQLCDVARLYYIHFNELQKRDLSHIYSRLGIARWVDLLHDVLVRYLGLESRFLPYQLHMRKRANWMMDDILCTGNFGFFDAHDVCWRDEQIGGRKNAFLRVGKRLWKYAPYAPLESVFFPLTQLYTRIIK